MTINYNLGGVWPPEMVPCWFPESVFRNGSCAKWNHAAARYNDHIPLCIPPGMFTGTDDESINTQASSETLNSAFGPTMR